MDGALGVDAAHYLLKPVNWDAFCEAMRRVHERMNTNTRRVRVTVGRTEVVMDVSGIRYIEVYGHKTVLHTAKAGGVGILSIRAMAERYGGMADFTYTPDTFTASVLLYSNK